MGNLLDRVAGQQRDYAAGATRSHRRDLGQIFTPPEIARFMASLFSPPAKRVRLLDPGAGFGILSLAYCERISRELMPHEIDLHLFETDPAMPEILAGIFDECKAVLAAAGHSLSYTIHTADFIAATSCYLEADYLFNDAEIPDDFDAVITNPPYFKLRKDSPQARLMSRVVHGQPNAYALFLALAARLLNPAGELVAISPRSFCNGLYFRGFRQWLFDHVSLDHVHLFESRTDIFKESGILQESIVTKWHRPCSENGHVNITHSWGRDIDDAIPALSVPTDEVICREQGHDMIRIPISQDDVELLRAFDSLPCTFAETGLRISTGPVVTFRATEHLRYDAEDEAVVPLLQPHNVRPFKTIWPIEKKQKPVAIADRKESRRLLVPTRNYVLLKRFSAKEEKRRLTAGCFLKNEANGPRVGLENHLNYIYHASRELTDDEVYGIAALFNSHIVDRYFRTISGNTQVNATEIRTLRFPPLETIETIGRQVREMFAACGQASACPERIEELILERLEWSLIPKLPLASPTSAKQNLLLV